MRDPVRLGALISDEHFGPTAYFQGKLRKLTAQAGELCELFVQRMNDEVNRALAGPVVRGDMMEGHIDGLPNIRLKVV